MRRAEDERQIRSDEARRLVAYIRSVTYAEGRASGLEAWDATGLPYLMERKSVASGDHVIGLEPSSSSICGRVWHEERGTVHRLAPLATERHVLTLTALEGTEEIDAAIAAFEDRYGPRERTS